MATIQPTRDFPNIANQRVGIFTWTPLAQGDDGSPCSLAQYADRSVQVAGTFGGATLRVEGSNDGTNWATLTDPQGNELLITGAKIEMVTEVTLYIRPVVVGGGGTTALTVALLFK